LEGRAAFAILAGAIVEDGGGGFGDALDFFLRDGKSIDGFAVEKASIAGSESAEGELFLSGNAELARKKDIERGMQLAGDLKGNRDASARDAQHNYIVAIGVCGKLLSQLPSRVFPIVKVLMKHGEPL
jgi:hypothetical protein